MLSNLDRAFLDAALALAERGRFSTTPNPRVGALIVKDGRVVGRGFHLRAGEPHAEAHALAEAGARARGATCYVSLEPCAHHGRTPPCADALIAEGIAQVVGAHRDPNPLVAGQGYERLRTAGVAVTAEDLAAAREINVGFFSRLERGRPWVRLKVATSLDGRTAMATGESRWITGEAARDDVQYWRATSCAILTGVGTVLADDPALTVRADRFAVAGVLRQPLRVIVDSQLRTPPDAKVLSMHGALVATTPRGDDEWIARRRALESAGIEILSLSEDAAGPRVPLAPLLAALGQRGINELLVEAGPTLVGALLELDLWDELVVYVAPKLLGSRARPFAELPLAHLADARAGRLVEQTRIGDDLRIRIVRA